VVTPEPFNVPDPRTVVPSRKLTLPVGRPDAAGVTVAVKVTDDPRFEIVADAARVDVVTILLTVNVCAPVVSGP
jgi:hypothetical protein